jgi:hypothetical protein
MFWKQPLFLIVIKLLRPELDSDVVGVANRPRFGCYSQDRILQLGNGS